jgi:DNA-directed RNA polymerase specialized sigma24 family protein
MANSPEPGRKSDWVLTQNAFRHLLDWLDAGSDSAGQRYLDIRRRLVLYFDRKNCHTPDELADETLNRVARRLDEEGGITIDAPAHYCYIVARFVLLEYFRSNRETVLSEVLPDKADTTEDDPDIERRSECLASCMNNLTVEDRELIRNYYQGEQRIKIENRRALAAKAGVTINALSIRACRIRSKLEACIQKCLLNAE